MTIRRAIGYVFGLAAVLTVSASFGATAFPTIPDPICGVNQCWLGEPDKPSWVLTDADLVRLKAIGVNTVRLAVYPKEIGLDGTGLVWTKDKQFDPAVADSWKPDWRALDLVLDRLAKHGLTPYICPHPSPATWVTIYIPEDADSVLWLSRLIVNHVHEKYGDNVIYGWYENIWRNSMEPWHTGVYRHTLSAKFPTEWHRMLSKFYDDKIGELNKTWGSNYGSFAEIPVPDMGTVKGVPEDAYESRRTYDLRHAIDLLSREKLTAWKSEIHRLAPGAMWVGACLHDGFCGMHDTRAGNPPMCNWGISTYAITSDVLAADNYQPDGCLMTAYRTIEKIASIEGKSIMNVEINGSQPSSFRAIKKVGGPVRGALAWCAREDQFGLIADDGTPKVDRMNAAKELFRAMREQRKHFTEYVPGKVYVYFPQETYEYAVLKASQLDAYEHICDKLPPKDLEPVLTDELGKLPFDASVFVLEKHLPRKAIDILNSMGSRVVSPHAYFVDESGIRIERTFVPSDFYAQLNTVKGGKYLLDAFQRVEEKERNIAYRDMGTTILSSTELLKLNEIDHSIPPSLVDMIDGNFATRIMFADKQQEEIVDVKLPRESSVDGAFVETVTEDPGRTPAQIRVLVSEDGTQWKEVAKVTKVTRDRTHIRFPATRANLVRFDFGGSTHSLGTRVIEIGVLGQ
ncbi:MAG: hypothetical protein ABFD54_12605 [Armatimonadota bacterium]|nr:hypothetical protein [bacterium]